jgi:hypothetical protein
MDGLNLGLKWYFLRRLCRLTTDCCLAENYNGTSAALPAGSPIRGRVTARPHALHLGHRSPGYFYGQQFRGLASRAGPAKTAASRLCLFQSASADRRADGQCFRLRGETETPNKSSIGLRTTGQSATMNSMPNHRDSQQEREDADWTARARQLSCLVSRVASNTRSMKGDRGQAPRNREIH